MKASGSLVAAFAERWWVPLTRGIAAILLGVFVLAAPAISLFTLAVAFASYAVADGLGNLVLAVRTARAGVARSGLLFFQGLIGPGAAALAITWPELTPMRLLPFIALWAVWTGTAAILAAIAMRNELAGEWLLGAGGVLSLSFGLMLVAFPGTGALTALWAIAAWALVFGAAMLGLSWELYRLGHLRPPHLPRGAPHPV
jgi:uncharacterized membrane protein HdeD (DUF308 family)